MAQWYDKYLSVYGKPFSEVPQDVVDGTRERLANLQSDKPLASIVVIAYNEESHLQACLWAISEIVCKYPVEIIGVNNDSKDRTAEIFERSVFHIIPNINIHVAMHVVVGCNMPGVGFISMLIAIPFILLCIMN